MRGFRGGWLGTAATVLVTAWLGLQAQAAPNVVNGDFEADPGLWTVWPGYSGQNGVNPANITGWTGEGGRGINPVVPGGPNDAPFRDNGNNTTHVAFLQGVSYIEQTIGGFSVGSDYTLGLDFNARNCCGGALPLATVKLNGIVAGSSTALFPPPGGVIPVGGTNPWYHADIEFTAPVDTITLRIESAPAAGGDSTLIVDNITMQLVPEPSSGLLALAGLAGLAGFRRRRA